MTKQPKDESTKDDLTEDDEGHDAREASVLPQRPILSLDEAEEDGGDGE